MAGNNKIIPGQGKLGIGDIPAGDEKIYNIFYSVHRKKKAREFPGPPSRDVTTKLSLGGNNDVITELFLPRGSLVSDIPAGDGKPMNLFLRCILSTLWVKMTQGKKIFLISNTMLGCGFLAPPSAIPFILIPPVENYLLSIWGKIFPDQNSLPLV
jgi:hypothetical protein